MELLDALRFFNAKHIEYNGMAYFRLFDDGSCSINSDKNEVLVGWCDQKNFDIVVNWLLEE
jgi:hypothetical protein